MTIPPVSALPFTGEVEARRSNSALQIGGVLWVVHYALQLAMGFAYGEVRQLGILGSSDGFCFLGAIFCFCVGLGTLARALWSHAWAAKVGLVLVMITMLGVCGSVMVVASGRRSGVFGGVGVIGTCLAALFVALAAGRVRLWSWRRRLLLLLIGALTFPLILTFGIPGQYVPAFLTDEIPFALSGLAFIAFARMEGK